MTKAAPIPPKPAPPKPPVQKKEGPSKAAYEHAKATLARFDSGGATAEERAAAQQIVDAYEEG